MEEGFDVETELAPVHEGLDCLVVVQLPDLPVVNVWMCGTDHGQGFFWLDHGFHADPGEDAFIVRPLQDRQAVLDGGGEGLPLLTGGIVDEAGT